MINRNKQICKIGEEVDLIAERDGLSQDEKMNLLASEIEKRVALALYPDFEEQLNNDGQQYTRKVFVSEVYFCERKGFHSCF